MDLEGRVAIVTGGARGIGLAIAQDFVRHGASVVVVDAGVTIAGEASEPALATAVAETLDAKRAVGVAGDIADAETARRAVALAQERFGGLDIVVNNAAIIRDGFVFKANEEAWEAVIRTNLTGAFRLLAAATPVMRERAKGAARPGTILNVVSSAGIYGNYGQAAYASAKAGLVGLTRVTALDLARSKITCNAIAPFAATRVTESIKPASPEQAAYKEKAMRVPPLYVARLASFLASPAGAGISGQLFGARGREVFLFSQARPAATVLQDEGGSTLDALASGLAAFGPHYTELVSDLEAFASDPVL